MEDIDEIMYLLNWNRSPTEQIEGIRRANHIKCIKCFFQPQGNTAGKPVWENCARIIYSRTDEDLEPYMMDMLLWIQDLNWPGAALIQQRLILFSKTEMLAAIVNRMVRSLSILDDDVWLNSIKGLEQNANLKTLLWADVVDILEKLDNA